MLGLLAVAAGPAPPIAAAEPVPVVLDTDIGDDVDDTWALAYLLRCPELELKLVLTASGDTRYRARLAANALDEESLVV